MQETLQVMQVGKNGDVKKVINHHCIGAQHYKMTWEMSVHDNLHFGLYLTEIQAYSIYIVFEPNESDKKHMNLLSFKQQVGVSLIELEIKKWQSSLNNNYNPVQILQTARPTSRGINETLGSISDSNKPKEKNNGKAQDIPCYLCKLCGMICKTIYGYPQCKVGFHVECFTALHYKDALKRYFRALIDLIKGSK